MIDRDLAELHRVETKQLKRQVRRNIDRFPEDFMFELSDEEFLDWRSQFGTSNEGDKMGLRYARYVSGSERVLERTQKIFHVCCTRAMENIAVFFHKPNAQVIAKAKEWFGEANVLQLQK